MDSYDFYREFERLPMVEQAMAVLEVLQSAAARGDAYLVEWALEQSALYEFYGDDEQLLMFEICSAASVAIQNGYVEVVEVLIKHFRAFSQELILECVGEMYRQYQNRVDLKPAIVWMS